MARGQNPKGETCFEFLKAIGILQSCEADSAAKNLYDVGYYANQRCRVSLICFGREHNSIIEEKYPVVPQILWSDVLPFIYERFKSYSNEKISHQQWDADGHKLWIAFEESRDASIFKNQFDL